MENFHLGEKGDFESSWNCNSRYNKTALNDLLKTLLSEYKSSITEYERIISNDGKLIGNEKILMIRVLSEMIQCLVFSRDLINKNYAKNKYSNPKLSISFRNELDFVMRGSIDLIRKQKIDSFGDWQKTILKNLIIEFTEEIKKTLEDKVITEEEAIGLCKIIDNLILNFLEVYYKLSYENLLK